MENEMRKDIDRVKNFGKFINENVDKQDKIKIFEKILGIKCINVFDGNIAQFKSNDLSVYKFNKDILTELLNVGMVSLETDGFNINIWF